MEKIYKIKQVFNKKKKARWLACFFVFNIQFMGRLIGKSELLPSDLVYEFHGPGILEYKQQVLV